MGFEELIEELHAKIDDLCTTVKNKLAIVGEMTLDELMEAVDDKNIITQWDLEFSDTMQTPIKVSSFPEISVAQMTDEVVVTNPTVVNSVISETIPEVKINHMTIHVIGM